MAEPQAPPAPELIVALVNTLDVLNDRDEIGTPEALGAWLRERSLIDTGVEPSADDRARVDGIREALRVLLFCNCNDDPPTRAALTALDEAGSSTRLTVTFPSADAPVLTPAADGVDGALAAILAAVYHSITEGTWTRVKACKRADCRWAFYDHSKNHSKTWCSMSVCGNRTKAETFRKRRSTSV